MTPFKIPESAYGAIQYLIHFSEVDFDAFLEALSKAEPSLDKDLFWSHVAKQAGKIDGSAIESILDEIFQLDNLRSENDMGIEEFAESIAEAASEVKSEKFPFEAKDVNIVKDRLIKIFQGREGLETTMKATGVVLDQDRVFFHARILTDIRPVFNENVDSVSAAVIVHNLRIHYGENSEHKDFYVALDTSDIQSLREVLDRADKKAKCLKGLLDRAKVSYLDTEE